MLLTLILSTLGAPTLAYYQPNSAADTGISSSTADDFGRRSGRCPHRPEKPLIDVQSVSREGSACGGV